MPTNDPFYNRKPVPDEFLEHVGDSGLSRAEELENRERKYSLGGGDLRKFSNPKIHGKSGKVLDPHYARKPVPDELIRGVGDTGLTKEEEFLNRERKYSVGGSDLRKFSDAKGGWHPSDDPYYGRKMVPKEQIEGVGDTGYSKAEEFEIRENKQSLFDLSSDPFQQITGSGHRASVSGPVVVDGAADARRRSSAVAPHHMHEEHAHHSGYDGEKLAPIESRADGDEIRPSTEGTHPTTTMNGPTTTTTTTTTTSVHPSSNVEVRDNTGHHVGETGHTNFYDAATADMDNIGPHDRA